MRCALLGIHVFIGVYGGTEGTHNPLVGGSNPSGPTFVSLGSKFPFPMSYNSPVTTEYWDDDGSAAYKLMFQRIEREEVVVVKPQ